MLIKYSNTNFSLGGNAKDITIEEGFKPYLDKMNDIAGKYDIGIVVIDSKRPAVNYVPGEIVPPAKMSNHIVGHAIDANIKWKGKYFNSALIMQYFLNFQSPIKPFISDCLEAGIRWGGVFNNEPDPVHFDDGLNVHNPTLWHSLNAELNAPIS